MTEGHNRPRWRYVLAVRLPGQEADRLSLSDIPASDSEPTSTGPRDSNFVLHTHYVQFRSIHITIPSVYVFVVCARHIGQAPYTIIGMTGHLIQPCRDVWMGSAAEQLTSLLCGPIAVPECIFSYRASADVYVYIYNTVASPAQSALWCGAQLSLFCIIVPSIRQLNRLLTPPMQYLKRHLEHTSAPPKPIAHDIPFRACRIPPSSSQLLYNEKAMFGVDGLSGYICV